MNAWTTYRSLNAEQKSIVRAKKVDVRLPVDELLTLLRPLAACDSLANKVQRRTGCTLALLILFTIVAWLFVVNAGVNVLTVALFALLATAAVVFLGLYIWLRRIDVSDNLRSFTIPVFTLLREDIDPSVPVHLRMDLSSPTSASKKTGTSAPYAQGWYYKIIDTTYLDPWMSAAAVLVDGTKLSWSVTDKIRKREKSRKNSRGKIKMKTKYRKISEVEAQVGLRTRNYTVAKAELSADGKRSKVEVETRVRNNSLAPLDPRALLDLVAGVYRSARRVTKEASA